jgi:DNA-directed RNA polymerase subunit alpha
MHIVQGKVGKPIVKEEKKGGNVSVFIISPLPSGFGHTLGNSIRRTLLSSIPGSGITQVKIKGVAHEYSSLDGVKDSILNIILNLKELAFNKMSSDTEIATISVSEKGDVKGSDIVFTSDTSVINNDNIITSISENVSLDIELQIEKSIGYCSTKEHKSVNNGWISIDTIFSPVLSVKYDVLPCRVGDITNLDELRIEITTNGSLSPSDSFKFSSQIMEGYFSYLQSGNNVKVEEKFLANFTSTSESSSDNDSQECYTPIEILNLSPRTLNALINGNIGSVEEVLSSSASYLESMRGFGKKAMSELTESLELNGYKFNFDN